MSIAHFLLHCYVTYSSSVYSNGSYKSNPRSVLAVPGPTQEFRKGVSYSLKAKLMISIIRNILNMFNSRIL